MASLVLDDQVYMDDEVCRNEYVLNDAGYVYKGAVRQIQGKPWQYGQVCGNMKTYLKFNLL